MRMYPPALAAICVILLFEGGTNPPPHPPPPPPPHHSLKQKDEVEIAASAPGPGLLSTLGAA